MHSPKFPLKVKDLRDVINKGRLKSTWKTKVRESMKRQLLPDPIENLDFHIRLEANCAAIESEIFSGSYIPRAPIRLLSEKSKGLCRQVVIPSAKDALVLQTLSDALWVEIRTKAPSKNAFYAPQDHKFSQGLAGHTNEYGPIRQWINFQETIFGFTKKRRFIVVTDIANYYDTIAYDHLRNILADLSLAREHALDLLLYTLSWMLWQPDYMPRASVGLPQINLDAPRLLAHCFLFEIDKFISSKPVDFARFMDDMDIGVDDLSQAKGVIRDLDLALQTRQIRLNSGKTKILEGKKAAEHFKIKENEELDELAASIEKKLKAKSKLEDEREAIKAALRNWFADGTFETGNGDKILKRLINLAKQTHTQLDVGQFRSILFEWPALRSNALQWWRSGAQRPEKYLPTIVEFCRTGIVDQAALLEVTTATVEARLPKTKAVEKELQGILRVLSPKTPLNLFCAAWLLSKYGSSRDVLDLTEQNVRLWVTEEYLSRMIGGLLPRMMGSGSRSKFEAICRRQGNPWSQAVLQFHVSLRDDPNMYLAVGNIISAANPTLPNRITHPKFLMLLSLLHSDLLEDRIIAHLKKSHSRALSDPFYKDLIPASRTHLSDF